MSIDQKLQQLSILRIGVLPTTGNTPIVNLPHKSTIAEVNPFKPLKNPPPSLVRKRDAVVETGTRLSMEGHKDNE